MTTEPEFVTIYRSAEHSAIDDAAEVCEVLSEAGLSPKIFGDDYPGVPSGACEVRVPAPEADRADQLLAAAEVRETAIGDPSHDLDLETIFTAIGATAEVEALGVRSVLEANGIQTVFISPPLYPNLRFVVKVPKNQFGQALTVLEEARAAGPQAAEEGAAE